MSQPKLSAAEAAAKWQRRTSAAGQDYAAGVQNTTKDWNALATAAIPAMVAGFQAAAQNGRIAAGFAKVSTAQWKQITAAKSGNFTAGVSAASALTKMTAGLGRVYQYIQAADAVIAGMPGNTPTERIQRSTAYLTAMHQAAVAAGGK